uniref:Uncharacterized protein n=1 Tax=Glossina palpalis gambiensis TaxID=67801 RepID=A0A1B0C6V5_9MUSC
MNEVIIWQSVEMTGRQAAFTNDVVLALKGYSNIPRVNNSSLYSSMRLFNYGSIIQVRWSWPLHNPPIDTPTGDTEKQCSKSLTDAVTVNSPTNVLTVDKIRS